MIGAFILLIFLYFVTQPILKSFQRKNPYFSIPLMNKLFWYHIFFWLVYYTYATFNASDSKGYYWGSANLFNAWFDAYDTGTKFINFMAYPFTKTLGFSYESAMLLFAWFGYLGFVYFYQFFLENSRFDTKLWGYDLITLLLFLPNMHFWTSSLGKGSLIFLGIGMFAYGMTRPQHRIWPLVIGSMIVYNIRPHMFLFMGVGAIFGYMTGKEKIPFYQKALVAVGFIGALAMFSDQILGVANIDEDNVLGSFEEFSTKRATSLSASGSGVDMNSYPLPLKLFTFWFRPLFVDAPNMLGIICSIENVFYLILTWKLVDKDFIKFLKDSSSLVKMSLTIFIGASIALSFVMANLGIASRQKSMVMYFLFFVILSFLEYKKIKAYRQQIPAPA
jgi:hypothetical protein